MESRASDCQRMRRKSYRARRNSVGLCPDAARKARVKYAGELKPVRFAIVLIGNDVSLNMRQASK